MHHASAPSAAPALAAASLAASLSAAPGAMPLVPQAAAADAVVLQVQHAGVPVPGRPGLPAVRSWPDPRRPEVGRCRRTADGVGGGVLEISAVVFQFLSIQRR